MVVEILPYLRVISFVPIPLCGFLLLHKAQHNKTSVRHLVFWLHADWLVCFLRADGYYWFLRLFLVHKTHLLIGEDRLSGHAS